MSETKKNIRFVCIVAFSVAVVCGLFLRFCVVSRAAEDTDPATTEAAAPDPATTEAAVPDPATSEETATGSDALPDIRKYMAIENTSGFNDLQQIYNMLLSIRNVLLLFFAFWFLTWTHARITAIVRRLNK